MDLTRVDPKLLDSLIAQARAHPRRRMNHNLHRMEDPIHRLLNAMEPDSYVAPHRHLAAPRAETLACIRGRGAIVLFGDDGTMTESFLLSPNGPELIVEVPAGRWHSLVAIESGTVFFEVKAGPYAPPAAADVANFAPASGSPQAAGYVELMRRFATR
jgi:cupin fold WbuC family metalloprotein